MSQYQYGHKNHTFILCGASTIFPLHGWLTGAYIEDPAAIVAAFFIVLTGEGVEEGMT